MSPFPSSNPYCFDVHRFLFEFVPYLLAMCGSLVQIVKVRIYSVSAKKALLVRSWAHGVAIGSDVPRSVGLMPGW